MLFQDSMEFIIAIIFVVAVVVLLVSAFGYQLVSSGRRLKKAQRLSSAILKYTPAFVMIILDEKGKVVSFKAREKSFQGYDGTPQVGKRIEHLTFLPKSFRENGVPLPGAQTNLKTTAPLKTSDGSQLFIDWEMLPFYDRRGKIEFKIAYGFDRTELLQTQEKLKVLSARYAQVEEQERKKIAEDLHDRIGEMLIVSKRGVAALKKQAQNEGMQERLEALSQSMQKFIAAARTLIFDLIPQALYSVGLAAAVESFATEFNKKHYIAVQLEEELGTCQIEQNIAIFLYKAIRECALNAIKHGAADQLRISMRQHDGEAEVSVEDNGSGFAPGKDHFGLKAESGFGLFNLKNRAEQFGGQIVLGESEKLGGGKVSVRIPNAMTEEE